MGGQFYQSTLKTILLEAFMVEASSIFPYSPLCSAAIDTIIDTMTDEILTLKEVAAYLKLAEKTAYKLAAEGKLPGFKVGGSWRFKREDIESWIEQKKWEGNDDKT
ncbi:MAG: excisionase family DNA binding protein [Candidatus Endobugula sp.]